MKRILAFLGLLLFAGAAQAQPVKIVNSCGTVSPAYSPNTQSGVATMDVNGQLCTAAVVSATASITGFPTTQSTGTPIAVTTGGVTGTLPAGAVVVASNVGATNGAYCKLGASATTSDQLIPPTSWFAFTVGASTQLTCITSTSTTTVNMVGGSGLPTGSGGGGGGGGGGGAVTNAGTFAVQLTGATNNINNIAGTISLPTGASTAAKQPALGTAGSASTDVLTVQGIASMTPFLTNPGTAANWGVNTLGSTTSGQSGQLALGAVTTASPTYTTAQTNALSLDTTGALRVNVTAGGAGGGAVFGPTAVGSANANPPVVIGGTVTGAAGQNVVGVAAKAASTAAAATDASLVTNESPNSQLSVAAGTSADSAYAGSGSASLVAILKGIYSAATSSIAAGTNTIGTVGQLPYPVGATPITASATGTTAATTATLAGTSGKTTYICGYSIRANATANTNVTNTITGVITATMSSIMWVPANTAGLGVDEQIFSPCIPASATNTGIAIVSGAPGTGGLVSSKGWGYQL